MKFRKKPVVVEAELYDGSKESIAKILKLGNSVMLYSDHLRIKTLAVMLYSDHLRINTLEGMHRADIGDWIIKGVKGELYPCKPDIFGQTYEMVKENEESLDT